MQHQILNINREDRLVVFLTIIRVYKKINIRAFISKVYNGMLCYIIYGKIVTLLLHYYYINYINCIISALMLLSLKLKQLLL